MKKNIIVAMLIVLPLVLQAQTILSDSLMLRMRRHLYVNKSALDSTTISYGNLWTHSLLYKKLINRGDTIPSIDILTFQDASPHAVRHILCVYKDKYHMVNMKQSYAGVFKDMMSFFEQNPDIDDRLLSIFNYLTHETYLFDTWLHHETGKWYAWWHQRDSLSKQLNIRIEDWVNY